MTIPLKQVIQAIEEANEVFTSFWDAKTGKTVYLADPLMTDIFILLVLQTCICPFQSR